MIPRILTLPAPLLGLLVVGFSVLVSLAGMHLVRRHVTRETLREHQDSAGALYSMVGVLYTVLLAFVVVLVWEDFTEAGEASHQEATRIGNLMRDSYGLPAEAGDPLRHHLLAYTRAVIENEWEALGHGHPDPVATAAYEEVWRVVYSFEPRTPSEEIFYGEIVERMNELSTERRLRLLAGQSQLPGVFWILLIGGAVITMAFSLLFWIESAIQQGLVIGALAGLMGFVLFVVVAMDHPFTGDLRVEPDAFQQVLDTFASRVRADGHEGPPLAAPSH